MFIRPNAHTPCPFVLSLSSLDLFLFRTLLGAAKHSPNVVLVLKLIDELLSKQ